MLGLCHHAASLLLWGCLCFQSTEFQKIKTCTLLVETSKVVFKIWNIESLVTYHSNNFLTVLTSLNVSDMGMFWQLLWKIENKTINVQFYSILKNIFWNLLFVKLNENNLMSVIPSRSSAFLWFVNFCIVVFCTYNVEINLRKQWIKDCQVRVLQSINPSDRNILVGEWRGVQNMFTLQSILPLHSQKTMPTPYIRIKNLVYWIFLSCCYIDIKDLCHILCPSEFKI